MPRPPCPFSGGGCLQPVWALWCEVGDTPTQPASWELWRWFWRCSGGHGGRVAGPSHILPCSSAEPLCRGACSHGPWSALAVALLASSGHSFSGDPSCALLTSPRGQHALQPPNLSVVYLSPFPLKLLNVFLFWSPCFPWPLVLVGHAQAWALSSVPHHHWGQSSSMGSGDTCSAGGACWPCLCAYAHRHWPGERALGTDPGSSSPGTAAQGPGLTLGPTALYEGWSSLHPKAAWMGANPKSVAQ